MDLAITAGVVVTAVVLIMLATREPEHMKWPCKVRGAAWDRATGKKMYDFRFTAPTAKEACKRLGREHAVRTFEWHNRNQRRGR